MLYFADRCVTLDKRDWCNAKRSMRPRRFRIFFNIFIFFKRVYIPKYTYIYRKHFRRFVTESPARVRGRIRETPFFRGFYRIMNSARPDALINGARLSYLRSDNATICLELCIWALFLFVLFYFFAFFRRFRGAKCRRSKRGGSNLCGAINPTFWLWKIDVFSHPGKYRPSC